MCSILVEQILAVQLEAHFILLAMIMTLQLMSMVGILGWNWFSLKTFSSYVHLQAANI